MDILIDLLDFLGVAVFAVSGALVAGRKGMDLLGVMVLAVVTALGGGTLRDVLLGLYPVFWIGDAWYLVVAVGAALGAFVTVKRVRPPVIAMVLLDALGLAAFTVVGTERALSAGVVAPIAILMGVMTGVAGGVLRDVLAGEAPVILHREVYATASAVGATVFAVVLLVLHARVAAVLVSLVVIVALRLAARRWGLSLPRLHLPRETV